MEERNKQVFLIVDGNMYAHRAFYAIAPLNSPEGLPTNAVLGFIKTLQKLIEKLKPTHLLVVWDGGLSQERKDSLPEYKQNRPPTPKSLEIQIGLILEYLRLARIPFFYQKGIEADDWVATVASKAAEQGVYVIIASADKDFLQLVSDNIGVINPADHSEKVWTALNVKEKTGVSPEQIVDWLSLIGDAVDNIQGVEGIGPKTATTLLNKFGSIDKVFENINKVTPEKLKTKLIESEELIKRNRQLIKLYTNLPCELVLDDYKIKPQDKENLNELFKKLGFKSMLKKDEPVKQEVLFNENNVY